MLFRSIIRGIIRRRYEEFNFDRSLRLVFDIVNDISEENIDSELICENFYDIAHILNLLYFYNKYMYNIEVLKDLNFNFEDLKITGYNIKYPSNINYRKKEKIMTHIRNSLSHKDRFKLIRDKKGNLLYEFKDYDNNGRLSFEVTIDFMHFFQMMHNEENDQLLEGVYQKEIKGKTH